MSERPFTSPADTCTVTVSLGTRSYEIVIGRGTLDRGAEILADWYAARFGSRSGKLRACVVTDRNVSRRYAIPLHKNLEAAGWQSTLVELEPGEPTKSLSVISGLYDRLVEMAADRQTLLVAVGGGVIGDAAGFAAATYARGIPFVQVPTTLLAQVDSSVGGKVGINHAQGKNLIGAFYQPFGVLIDIATLKSLPERDYRSGLAEVVKYGVILDEAFFAFLESRTEEINRREEETLRQIVAQCCRLKADVVEADEEERTGLRAVLNYGHTFAHALEALSGYGTVLHGEAVAMGMVLASRLAERLKRISPDVTERQVRLLSCLGLPVEVPAQRDFTAEELLERMRLDKKSAAGRLRFVLPTRIGHVELVDDVPEKEALTVLQTKTT